MEITQLEKNKLYHAVPFRPVPLNAHAKKKQAHPPFLYMKGRQSRDFVCHVVTSWSICGDVGGPGVARF